VVTLCGMAGKVNRVTVDLESYPDLVVIYLGMRVNSVLGLGTRFKFGPRIQASVDAKPDGLLLHENMFFGFFPPHFGMRQYWRDFESLESWSRTMPHQRWWQEFVRDSGGTGFWHETYFMRGGMEAIYDNVPVPVGWCHVLGAQARWGRRGCEDRGASRGGVRF
jgi:hypothetical protein